MLFDEGVGQLETDTATNDAVL